VANDVVECWPEPPAIRLREFLPGVGDGLAGESTANKVRGWPVSPPFGAGSDVVMAWHLRPVLLKDAAAPGVDLYLAGDGHAGALEAEVEAADAGEQGEDVHGVTTGSWAGHGCHV